MALEEKRSFLVIGLGRFGSNVAKAFYQNGHDVLAIDRDMNAVQKAVEDKLAQNAMQIDATDASSLRRLELDRFYSIIVSVGTCIEDSVLICATLKDLEVSNIIAKASSDMHGKILEKIGVGNIVYPEAEMGKKVANQLMGLSFLDEFPLTENFSISEVPVTPEFHSKTLSETEVRSKFKLNILAIRRAGGHFSISPSPSTTFQKEDMLLVIGTHDDIEAFKNHNTAD